MTGNCSTLNFPIYEENFILVFISVYHSLYSSTEQLQVALWIYMFLNLGLNNDKCIHTLPLRSVPFHISPSPSLPQTLVPLSVWLLKLKELLSVPQHIVTITHTHTHTHTHTDRQSTVDMINCNIHILLIYAFISICFGLFRLILCLFRFSRNTETRCFDIEAKQPKQMFCFG
jgi:hypothetical protein